MITPRILVLSGSTRGGSYNSRLAALAVKELALIDAVPTRISLADYPLPLFDADLETDAGIPAHARRLVGLLQAHDGVFIAAPEYNAGIAPVLKNAIDWMSRVHPDSEEGLPATTAFHGRAFALASASSESHGGLRGLMALRQVLELGLGASVLPDQVTVADAGHAFTERDDLADRALAVRFRGLIGRLAGGGLH
ncbi:MAG: NADPH-dependent FMN reductase [Hyphomicrobiales bacterium]|nr:MAG: NADPH-dependent FMN reductase [Hyphomicrobiales bacterium]